MNTPRAERRQRRYPYERGVSREQIRAAARAALLRYLDQVTAALRGFGFEVTRTHLVEGGDLEAVLTVVPTDPSHRNLPPVLELSWAEDTGWALSHHLISNTATPWRYLHTELVPPPVAVARFLALTARDDDAGLHYPAQFRFRCQPLRPVLDELTRHDPTPGPAADRATACPTRPGAAAGAQEGA